MEKKVPQHNVFKFPIKNEATSSKEIIFDSDFDSGNCAKVEQIGLLQYNIYTANDGQGTDYESHPKSWFYFSVTGFPRSIVKFTIRNLHMLWAVSKQPELYRPACKIDNEPWQRLEKSVSIYTRDNEIEIQFEQLFSFESQKIYFAFSYPYSYSDLQEQMALNDKIYRNNPHLYYNREILIKTPQQRNIDLIVISSYDGQMGYREPAFNQNLFPEITKYQRPYKFRTNKPVIFLTARVHPGEAPGSHSMNGVLNFLLKSKDARAYFLRKYFVFYIIPMLNPDGVYNGHYRMDIYNQNLNRYYLNPDPNLQPGCFGVRQIADKLQEEQRLFFYCDFHAHGGRKGCFFYGNAIDEFIFQVESQLHARILNLNCMNFEYDYCDFSRRQMVAKDRFEDKTKEGCGRVCFFKIYKLIHSYTLECGFHSSNFVSQVAAPMNIHRKFQLKLNFLFFRGYGYEEEEAENPNSDIYKKGPPFYTISIYENIGKTFLVSILDIFEKNPYSRINNTQFKTIQNLRRELAVQCSKLDRFRKEDGKLQQKVKKINEMIQDNFYSEFTRRKVFDESRISKNPQKRNLTVNNTVSHL